MKITAILTTMLGIALSSLHAQTVPPFINYQGRVTDSEGVGLGTDNPVNRKVIFRIFDAPSAGTRLWSEQHTVTISNGEFSVLLGNGINANYAGADEAPLKTSTPLDTVFTSAGILRFVEIVVDNGDNTLNTGDAPIAPRQQITSTAYSFRARSADTIASGTDLQLNGSANYGLGYYGGTRPFNGAAIDGPVLFGQAGGALGSVNGGAKNIALRWNSSGNVGIGSADLSGAAATTKLVLQGNDSNAAPMQLNIRGNSDTNKRLLLGYNTTSNYGSLQAYSGASTTTNLLLNPSGGSVGIGTTTVSPNFTLQSKSNSGGAAWDGGAAFGGNTNAVVMGQLNGVAQLGGHNGALGAWANLSINSGGGNVGIGTTNPQAKLDVVGDLKISGGVTTGTGANQMIGHAPVIMETKSANDQTNWGINYFSVNGWEDRPGGFKIRIYAQKETAAGDYEVRNYEATVVVEQSGYANNPEFPGIKRISVAWVGGASRASMKLRTSGTTQEIATSDGWFKMMNTQPSPTTGSAAYYLGNNNTIALVFLPDVSGKIVVSDY